MNTLEQVQEPETPKKASLNKSARKSLVHQKKAKAASKKTLPLPKMAAKPGNFKGSLKKWESF